jgi:thymidine phosphorylase
MGRNLQLIRDFDRLRTDNAMSCLVAAVEGGGFESDDLHHLAEVLATSGTTIDFGETTVTADLASTGSPGSLSTLLGPLYLLSYNLVVPKLGVPGRPAGGIDVLAQLPGYKTTLNVVEARAVVARCGYVHILAGGDFAPLDAALFRYRQIVGAQNVPALAAASLLAKKIAFGVKFAGLDVRVSPHGNFGGTFTDARRAAMLFCAAARASGIEAVAILTDARNPYQPFVGRGEALLAMKLIFERRADDWLMEHDHRCRLMAAHVASMALGAKFEECGTSDIEAAFEHNLEAQGSSMDAFGSKVDAVEKAPRRELIAPREGFLSVDVAELRSAFLAVYVEEKSGGQFLDELGIIIRARPSAYVRRGDVLASVRASDATWASSADRLVKSFQVVDLVDCASGMEDIIRG